MDQLTSAFLAVEKGLPGVEHIPLGRPVLVLGKASTADLVIDSPFVSRQHAQVSREGERYRIRDLGSTNGTFVNGARLGSDPRWLESGDRIELARGQVVLRFYDGVGGTVALGVGGPQTMAQAIEARPVAPDGTVTIMFSDIQGSTAMTDRLGDRKAQEVLRRHNAAVRSQVAAHGGFEVKSQGDGFMVAFPSARRALLCAMDVQRSLAEHRREHPEEPIHVRIGLHTGEAIKEGNDFFGRNVIMAARIAAAAEGDEILVSSLLKQLTDSAGDIQFGEGRDVSLKGLSGVQRVHAVHWA